jgi:hypothetical protein
MTPVQEATAEDPIAFALLSRDLERGGDAKSVSPSPDQEYEAAVTGKWKFSRFSDEALEQLFRDEVFPRSNSRARLAVKVFMAGSLVMYLLAVTNPQNSPNTFQLSVIPAMLAVGVCILFISHRLVKTEAIFQMFSVLVSALMHFTITANAIAANRSLVDNHVDVTRERFLFHMTHMGWMHTVVLVFLSIVVRPRLPYMMGSSALSFLVYLIGGLSLKTTMSMHENIMSSSIMYLLCCAFNVYANWHLEQSERKAYFLSSDLEKKLKREKEKLRQMFLRTTWLTQQLTEEKVSRYAS